MRGYFDHLRENWRVAGRGLLICFFHFVHGLIPVKYTSHNYWGFSLHGRKEKVR
jgi:hypothetical protein